MKSEFYFVTCDIVAHSAEPNLETQKRRVIAINAVADGIIAGNFEHNILWACTGDGGHLAIPTEAPVTLTIDAIRALRKWSLNEGVRLRVSATIGTAECVTGAAQSRVLVGHGINLAGHVMPFSSPSRVVVSAGFREKVEGKLGPNCRFHDSRTVRLKHGTKLDVALLSISGEFESTWDDSAGASDRRLLRRAIEDGDAFSVIYRARRLLEMNRKDPEAIAALRTLAVKKVHFLKPTGGYRTFS